MLSNAEDDLPTLIRGYAQNLRDQAQILSELPGQLTENGAERDAYLAVASDLDRILAHELGLTGIIGGDATQVA